MGGFGSWISKTLNKMKTNVQHVFNSVKKTTKSAIKNESKILTNN